MGVLEKFYRPNVTMVMPVETARSSIHFMGLDYVHFVEVLGVYFMGPRATHDPTKLTKQLFYSVLNTWPLFVTALLMALIAGCVVWVLVSEFKYSNTDDHILP